MKNPFSLIIIDLDDFKIVNDKYGHLEGNRALKHFAEILSTSVRKEDIVSRFAGDEFLIIVESELKDAGKNLIERIQTSLDELNASKVLSTDIAFSAGVLCCDNLEYKTSKELISRVDKSMYMQKKKNKSI